MCRHAAVRRFPLCLYLDLPCQWLTALYFGHERHEHSKASEPQPRNPSIRDHPPLNPTMFQNSSNFKIDGGSFINNNTVVNEQIGMTGALYESVVNRYFLTSIYAKASRYCIDGSRTAPLMTLLNMHLYVTQILARILLVKS